MEVEFEEDSYDRLETDATFTAGFDRAIVSLYRKRLHLIRSLTDERELQALKSLGFEKLKGNEHNWYSIQLNAHACLIVQLRRESKDRTIRVIKIENHYPQPPETK